jgi:hypothetical protein
VELRSRGFALDDEFRHASIGGGGIFLVQCLEHIKKDVDARDGERPFKRVIVFTDEQDCDTKANPALAPKLGQYNYIVNVANYKQGTGYKNGWHHIDGWSERIFDYIDAHEKDLTPIV